MTRAKAAERYHMDRVAQLGCVVCKRAGQVGLGYNPLEIHHIATGSGKRSHFSVARLCYEHHRGHLGINGGMGLQRFIRLYRPPGDTEYGLLVWVNEDLAELDLRDVRRDKGILLADALKRIARD